MDPLTFDYLDAKQIKAAEKKIHELFPLTRNQKEVSSNSENPSTSSIQKSEKNSRSDEINDFNNICGVTITKSKDLIKILSTKEELAIYISSKGQYADVSAYWRDHEQKLPKLSSLVRKYGMIQASSVASESAFSIANYIQRKERSSLSAENLRYSIFLREMPKIDKLYEEYC